MLSLHLHSCHLVNIFIRQFSPYMLVVDVVSEPNALFGQILFLNIIMTILCMHTCCKKPLWQKVRGKKWNKNWKTSWYHSLYPTVPVLKFEHLDNDDDDDEDKSEIKFSKQFGSKGGKGLQAVLQQLLSSERGKTWECEICGKHFPTRLD